MLEASLNMEATIYPSSRYETRCRHSGEFNYEGSIIPPTEYTAAEECLGFRLSQRLATDW